MRKETLFKSNEIHLEKIYLPFKLGQSFVYREIITKQKDELIVKEYNEMPQWYIRQLKLKILLDK